VSVGLFRPFSNLGGRPLPRGVGVLVCAMLIAGLAAPARAAFPGSNGKIAFGWADVYTVDNDGSNFTNLTPNTSESVDGEPAWSPDGTKIAFSSDRASAFRGNTDIWVMNADGSNPVRLTSSRAKEEWPAWSPDGQFIVFSSGEEFFGGEILIMKSDGSQRRQLLRIATGFPLTQPRWSPDGTLIAFGGPTPHYGIGIYVIKPDGTGRRKLTDPNGGYDLAPNWSPDGARIVFSRAFQGTYNIWTMNADGSDLKPITSGDDEHPAWSPDGAKIVFERGGAETWDLWTMNPDGSEQAPLFQSGGDDIWPDWQPLP
jgi:Tol biopolymer transport system component